MRAIPKVALVLAALALPLAAVIVSLLLTSGARAPGVPSQVDVGRVPTSQGGPLAPGGPPQSEQDDQHDDGSPAPPAAHAPGQLPPPAPNDDDVDDGPGNGDDQHEGNDD